MNGESTDTIDDADGVISKITSQISSNASIDNGDVIITSFSSDNSTDTARLRRQLSSSFILVGYVITGIVLEEGSINIGQAVSAYISSPAFVTELQTADSSLSGLTAVSGVTYEAIAITTTTENDDTYAYSCVLTSEFTMKWNVNSTDNTVVAVLAVTDAANTKRWISGGVVSQAGRMVPTDSAHRHSVYIYDPLFGRAGLYRLNGYTAAGINRDYISQPIGNGITSLNSHSRSRV